MKLSIVTTLYQSENYIKEFYERSCSSAEKIFSDNYEIIFVNDGSTDNSLKIAIDISKNDEKVLVIDLSRNFGHHQAIIAGISKAKGDLIFVIDGDLEEEPEWVIKFHDIMKKKECDVVFGVQNERKGSIIEKLSGSFFYKTISYFSNIKIPSNQTVARLMTRTYCNNLLRLKESTIFFSGITQYIGFDQIAEKVTKKSTSPSTYTFRKKMKQTLDAISSFSSGPLYLICLIGIILSIISFTFIAFVFFNSIFSSNYSPGWPSIIGAIFLIGGITITIMVVIGIYIANIFQETKRRPLYIIKKEFRKNVEK